MAFHDLTTHDNMSIDIKTFLVLGPKFYIQQKGFNVSDTIRMIDIFKIGVRLHAYLISIFFDEDDEIPRFHSRNMKWQPPEAIGSIKDFLKNF